MSQTIRRRIALLAGLAAAPFVLVVVLLNIAATVAVMVFCFFLWLTTRPLRTEMQAARAKITPRFRRRLALPDDHVDEEFARIVAGEASQEA